MDPDKMKAQMANVTCIEKEPAVYEKLMETVTKSALLKMLDNEQKDKIVKAFSGKSNSKIERSDYLYCWHLDSCGVVH